MQNKTICKNCDHRFNGNYCNHCGQSADTHKLSLHFIWHDLQHGLFHFDNGIFYTIQQLLTRPGHSIREFINGKRVRHFKPFSFVVVIATIYGFLYHYLIDDLFEVQSIHTAEDALSVYQKVINWTLEHFAYASLILIFTTTVASCLVFKKKGYNAVEHLVLNTFYRGLVLVISLILFPVLYFINHKGDMESFKTYALIFQLLDLVLMYWCYTQFFNKLTKLKSLGLTVLTYLFMTIINMALGYVAGLIIMAVE